MLKRNVLQYLIQQIEGRECVSLTVNNEIVSHLGSHSTVAINQQMGGLECEIPTNQRPLAVVSNQ